MMSDQETRERRARAFNDRNKRHSHGRNPKRGTLRFEPPPDDVSIKAAQERYMEELEYAEADFALDTPHHVFADY